jgi:hypothetical protein
MVTITSEYPVAPIFSRTKKTVTIVSYVSTWAHSHEELENKFGSLTKGA